MKPGASLDSATLRMHIRATLQFADLWSPPAEELLLGTCAQESHLGTYRRQLGGGPALGIYQIEKGTENSLWADYLAYKPAMARTVAMISGVTRPDSYQLEMNLAYQHLMARLRYFAWAKEPIPNTLGERAEYWKDHYNTKYGAGTPEEYIENYSRFIG